MRSSVPAEDASGVRAPSGLDPVRKGRTRHGVAIRWALATLIATVGAVAALGQHSQGARRDAAPTADDERDFAPEAPLAGPAVLAISGCVRPHRAAETLIGRGASDEAIASPRVGDSQGSEVADASIRSPGDWDGALAVVPGYVIELAPESADELGPPRSPELLEDLHPRQRRHIERWFQRVGDVEPDESFGELVARAARARLGTPYGALAEPKGEERLVVQVDRLDCLTLIETSNAVARCVWMGTPGADCFVEELRQTRYRGGRVDGYASRLHYFEDWMADNVRRARLKPLVADLGLDRRAPARGEAVESPGRRAFDFMTRHPWRYPALAEPSTLEAIAYIEARISEVDWPVIPKAEIPTIVDQVRDGDIIGFVRGTTPGLGVGHTGMVTIDRRGRPRVLHATDHSGRVSLSSCDLASCEARRSGRVGVMIMRPLPPPREPVTATATIPALSGAAVAQTGATP